MTRSIPTPNLRPPAVRAACLLAAALLLPATRTDGADIKKLAAGQMTDPLSLQAAPGGDLVVLDQRGGGAAVLRVSPDGKKTAECLLPAALAKARTAAADAGGRWYVLADGKAWALPADGKGEPETLEAGVADLTVKKTPAGETLFLLKKPEVLALAVADRKRKTIPLSAWPAAGGLGPLRVRADGHLYAYADAERLVHHFDAAGALVEKFGSGGDIRCGIPSGCVGPCFDVDDGGDLYWSLADYGTLARYTADGKTGIQFNGQEAWDAKWTGPIHTLCGFALSGDRAFETDRGLKRLTSFLKATVAPGAPDCDTVNTLAFGLNLTLKADRPYKLFTAEKAVLKAGFDAGNRRLHDATVAWSLRDFGGKAVAQGKLPCALPGEAAAAFDLPLALPRLGWYELDAAVVAGGAPLLERVVFLGRVAEDPRVPIPAAETSGWSDPATHAMAGLGLHRVHYQPDPKEFEKTLQVVANLRQRGIPYFLQITDKKHCTPAIVKEVLAKIPDLPALEIVNEPNLNTSPADYVKLLGPCFEAAKAASPKVLVLGPAQCGTELGWFEAFLKTGGGRLVDGVSVHTYMRHNSMDPFHWQWKLARLREVMAANGCGEKPLWQTEHGFLGDYHGHLLRHRWQARMVMLESLVLDRSGIGPERYFYYYLNEGGFGGFSSYLVNGRRELYPAALMTRERAIRLGGRRFARGLDLGTPGNWLALATVYEGPDADVLVLVNCGALDAVEVEVALPAGAKGFDAFGNPAPLPAGGRGRLAVDRYPLYIVMPHGAAVQVSVPGFGTNVAPEAKVVVENAEAAKKAAFLTNGALEFDFENEPERDGFRASADALPLDVTLQFDAPREIAGAVVYGSLADNDKCTPTAYEVHVRADGAWRKVGEVRVPVDGRVIVLEPLVKRVTWYDDPWIFPHRFPAVKADAIRFRFTATTFGQWPVKEVMWKPLPARVHLREIQVFAPGRP